MPMTSDIYGVYPLCLSIILQILMHFHPQKQAYYDVICGTYVVHDKELCQEK